MYTQLRRDQRVALATLRCAGYSQARTASAIGVSTSTLSRELRRNARMDGTYDARSAGRTARVRRAGAKHHTRILEHHTTLARIIELRMRATLSPEQVAHEVHGISHASIYAWIARSRPDLTQYLRRRGKKRRRYGTVGILSRYQAAKRPLANRPRIVATRARIGDWEGDTARGGNRTSALLVYAERKSRFVVARTLVRATADAVYAETIRLLRAHPVHTITDDNGSEFALHRGIEANLGVRVYFARPGHPEERGTCENTIGLIREFFPKGTNFATVSRRRVARALWLLNHRPRKCLFWQTPCRVFGSCCTSD